MFIKFHFNFFIMNEIKAILFDMDGVLVDSMFYHIKAWQMAFEDFGIKISDEEFKRMGGISFKDTIDILSKKYGKVFSDEDKLQIHMNKVSYFMGIAKIKVFAGVYDNLLLLKKKGFKIAVVSGAIRSVVNRVVNENFEGVFDCTLSSDDVIMGKPAPDSYLKAAEYLGVKPNECIVVEDAISGVCAGKDAGMIVYAITTTMKKEDLVFADKIFNRHEELFCELLKV